jgi:hypothetical protein
MAEWTRDMVEERVEEAADVLRQLPPVRLSGYFSTWPDILRSFGDRVGANPVRELGRGSEQRSVELVKVVQHVAGLSGKYAPPSRQPYLNFACLA